MWLVGGHHSYIIRYPVSMVKRMCKLWGSKNLIFGPQFRNLICQNRKQQMPWTLEASDIVRIVVVSYYSRKFRYGGYRKEYSISSFDWHSLLLPRKSSGVFSRHRST